MASPTSFSTAGAFKLQMWLVDNDGYPTGQLRPENVDTTSSSVFSNAYVSRSFTGMSPSAPDRRLVEFFGNEGYLGNIMLGANTMSEGSFTMASLEETFNALLTKSAVDVTTMTNWAMSTDNEMLDDLPRVGFMVSTKARTWDLGVQWTHVVFPDVQVEVNPQGVSGSDGTNPNELTYNFRPSPATRSPLGLNFSELNMDVAKGQAISFRIRINSQLSLFSWWQDDAGTETTIQLPYLPTSDDTGGADNSFVLNGTANSVTSVDTVTGAITVTAGAQGDRLIGLYATDFVEAP